MARAGQSGEGGRWVYPSLAGAVVLGTLAGVLANCGGGSEQSGAPFGGEMPIERTDEMQSALGSASLRHITIDPSQFTVQ